MYDIYIYTYIYIHTNILYVLVWSGLVWTPHPLMGAHRFQSVTRGDDSNNHNNDDDNNTNNTYV